MTQPEADDTTPIYSAADVRGMLAAVAFAPDVCQGRLREPARCG